MAGLEDSGEGRSPGRERATGHRRYQPPPVDPPRPLGDPLFASPAEIGANGLPTGVEREVPGDEPDWLPEPLDPASISIKTQSVTVSLLLSRLGEGTIDLAPDFQRRAGIWSAVRQSRLIESLLLRIPISTFFMAQRENGDWAVVDGIQRLTAIARFMDTGAVGGPLALEGLEYLQRMNGMVYRDLPGRLRIRLREAQMVVNVIQHGTPEAVQLNVFSRINTVGVRLSAQEIRHAMIPGPARDFLGDLAEDAAFGEATGWSVSDERMADREMVLRFLAFSLSPPAEYRQQDFDQFLADAMHRVNRLTGEAREELALEFRKAMTLAHGLFGEHTFRKSLGRSRKSAINKALFETVAVNLAALDDRRRGALVASRDEVVTGLQRLLTDWDFDRAISIATGDPKKVRTRFAKVDELFQGVLDSD